MQEIYNNDYKPELDNLPYAYTDKTAGHTYTYSDTNNLISETNEYGITTDYTYSDVGTLYKKSFDIYDYYYQNDGRCDRIDVSGETVIDYEYNVTDSSVKLSNGQHLNTITYADGTVEQQILTNTVMYIKNVLVIIHFMISKSQKKRNALSSITRLTE